MKNETNNTEKKLKYTTTQWMEKLTEIRAEAADAIKKLPKDEQEVAEKNLDKVIEMTCVEFHHKGEINYTQLMMSRVDNRLKDWGDLIEDPQEFFNWNCSRKEGIARDYDELYGDVKIIGHGLVTTIVGVGLTGFGATRLVADTTVNVPSSLVKLVAMLFEKSEEKKDSKESVGEGTPQAC